MEACSCICVFAARVVFGKVLARIKSQIYLFIPIKDMALPCLPIIAQKQKNSQLGIVDSLARVKLNKEICLNI